MIGLAVITFRRQAYLLQCLDALAQHSWGGAYARVVIVDEPCSSAYSEVLDKYRNTVPFSFAQNGGVAAAKNRAFHRLLNERCQHIFVIENDILMKRADTCDVYIDYALRKGVQHLNFAYHGPLNQARTPFQYTNASKHWFDICCHLDCVGAFSYYTRKVLQEVGTMDECFHNCYEHVDHTYRIAKAGLTTPFWCFADVPDSRDYLQEIPGSGDGNSSIGPLPSAELNVLRAWEENKTRGMRHWVEKHGPFPSRPSMQELMKA